MEHARLNKRAIMLENMHPSALLNCPMHANVVPDAKKGSGSSELRILAIPLLGHDGDTGATWHLGDKETDPGQSHEPLQIMSWSTTLGKLP
jgi:hypothetical protein